LKTTITREESVKTRLSANSGIVDITGAKKASATLIVCVAIIGNTNISVKWTSFRMTIDCCVFLLCLQRKSPSRNLGWILECEKKAFHTRVHLILALRVPFHWGKASENVPMRVHDHSQSVCVTVAADLKIVCAKTVAAPASENCELSLAELGENIGEL
jgi:hypothetical protein